MAVNNKIGLFLCYFRKGDLTILQRSRCSKFLANSVWRYFQWFSILNLETNRARTRQLTAFVYTLPPEDQRPRPDDQYHTWEKCGHGQFPKE